MKLHTKEQLSINTLCMCWNIGQNCNNCHSSYRDKALYFSKQMEVIAEFWASIRDTKMGKKKKDNHVRMAALCLRIKFLNQIFFSPQKMKTGDRARLARGNIQYTQGKSNSGINTSSTFLSWCGRPSLSIKQLMFLPLLL